MRFLTAYLSQSEGERTITGTERMKNRPIRVLVEALRQLGADIEYVEKEGFPPLKIRGKKLRGGRVHLDGGVSSQYTSALMMIAPVLSEGLSLSLEGTIISRPYIRMTVQLMKAFGIDTVWSGNIIEIKHQNYVPCSCRIENDWSAASYWYEILALTPGNATVELPGLNDGSVQGDAKVSELFEKLGVSTTFTESGARLSKRSFLIDRFDYDFIDEPDLAQTFAVTCALKNIPFRFTGLQSLKMKETDRIKALQKEMRKLGYVVHDRNGDTLEWTGERCEAETSPAIDTYDDHRMAMAFAPAAIRLGEICINDPAVVSKSYPRFWKDLESTGFKLVTRN
jgi:3-phosphoshikimate 1-carboxyvinyltransferase